jgi:hypothetical protein
LQSGEIEAGFWRGGVSDTPDANDKKENKQQQLGHRRIPFKLQELKDEHGTPVFISNADK